MTAKIDLNLKKKLKIMATTLYLHQIGVTDKQNRSILWELLKIKRKISFKSYISLVVMIID